MMNLFSGADIHLFCATSPQPGINGHLAENNYLWSSVGTQFSWDSISIPTNSKLVISNVGKFKALTFLCGVDDKSQSDEDINVKVSNGAVLLHDITSLAKGGFCRIEVPCVTQADFTIEVCSKESHHRDFVVIKDATFLNEQHVLIAPTVSSFIENIGFINKHKYCVSTIVTESILNINQSHVKDFIDKYKHIDAAKVIFSYTPIPFGPYENSVYWVQCNSDDEILYEEQKLITLLLPKICSADSFLIDCSLDDSLHDWEQILYRAASFKKKPAFFANKIMTGEEPVTDQTEIAKLYTKQNIIPKVGINIFIASRRTLLAIESNLAQRMPYGLFWAKECRGTGRFDVLVQIALAETGGVFALER